MDSGPVPPTNPIFFHKRSFLHTFRKSVIIKAYIKPEYKLTSHFTTSLSALVPFEPKKPPHNCRGPCSILYPSWRFFQNISKSQFLKLTTVKHFQHGSNPSMAIPKMGLTPAMSISVIVFLITHRYIFRRIYTMKTGQKYKEYIL